MSVGRKRATGGSRFVENVGPFRSGAQPQRAQATDWPGLEPDEDGANALPADGRRLRMDGISILRYI